jgi:hypothetical protein
VLAAGVHLAQRVTPARLGLRLGVPALIRGEGGRVGISRTRLPAVTPKPACTFGEKRCPKP